MQSDTANEYENLKPLEESQQNRKLWPNLVCMSEMYQVSDRSGAAMANSALQDAVIIRPFDKLFVIDKNELRQRNKYRQEIRTEEDRFFELINGIYVDGSKIQLWF